jgi:hypothetical protein
MFTDFQREYEKLSDDEILELASHRGSLTDDARSALESAIRNRNLTAVDLAKHENFTRRSDQRDKVRRNKILFGTKRTPLEWLRFAFWVLVIMSIAAMVALWVGPR